MKTARWVSLVFLIGLGAMASAWSRDVEADDKEACRRHLRFLHEAIQSYRETHKELPDKLSDLYPRHLGNRDWLICPAGRRRGIASADPAGYKPSDIPDPQTTYLYEFRPDPIPDNIPGGGGRTMREFKRRQMALAGGRVPIVRCMVHDVNLNLGFDGQIYETPDDWELEFNHVFKPGELSAGRVLADAGAAKFIRIPARDSRAPAWLLDLSDFFNGSLKQGWTADSANNLAALSAGVGKFNGVQFDVRGVIQLRGAEHALSGFPVAVTNIPVGLRGRALHFLQAASHGAAAGARLAKYTVRYEDGRTESLDIRYGEHVIDWWSSPEKNFHPRDGQACQVAWSGSNERVRAKDPGKLVHLYQTRWLNPRPDVRMVSLDLVSSLARSGPFVLAVTVEP